MQLEFGIERPDDACATRRRELNLCSFNRLDDLADGGSLTPAAMPTAIMMTTTAAIDTAPGQG